MLEDEVKNTIMLFDKYVTTNIFKHKSRKEEHESNQSDNQTHAFGSSQTAAVSHHSLVPNVQQSSS